MSNVQEIEEAIVKLAPPDLAKLREWFAELDADDVDRRLEEMVKSGHFDALAEQALKDLKAGKCAEL
ncbi:MAG TPA: hypothetical protein VKX17_12445 [Planctomycetota bacterium]|nr:hypothetical protein [Planctomycetota bacterium]